MTAAVHSGRLFYFPRSRAKALHYKLLRS